MDSLHTILSLFFSSNLLQKVSLASILLLNLGDFSTPADAQLVSTLLSSARSPLIHQHLDQHLIASTDSSTPASATPSTTTPTQRRVQVFFPKHPEATEDFTYVVSVNRTTSSISLARFAIAQLIAGPTTAEQQQGLRAAVTLQGTSTCGSDFTISITNGVAKLQFCRPVVSAGVGDDARTKSAIEATLKQFSTVSRVVILNPNGNCLGDQSGLNLCL